MANGNNSKAGMVITILVVIIIAGGAILYFVFRGGEETTTTNVAATNTITNTTTNTAANTNATTNTNTVVEVMGDSKQVVRDLLAAASAEWAEDAVVHSLQSVASITSMNGVTTHGGYEDGAYREWFGGMYSPSTGESALVAWQDGVAAIGEPYPGDDFSIAVSNSLTSLNPLATGKSSSEVYAEAVAQGLVVDGVNTYAEMDILSATDPSNWVVKQVSATEVDEYEVPLVLESYTVASGI